MFHMQFTYLPKLTIRPSRHFFFCSPLSVRLGESSCTALRHLFTLLTFSLKRISLYLRSIPIIRIPR